MMTQEEWQHFHRWHDREYGHLPESERPSIDAARLGYAEGLRRRCEMHRELVEAVEKIDGTESAMLRGPAGEAYYLRVPDGLDPDEAEIVRRIDKDAWIKNGIDASNVVIKQRERIADLQAKLAESEAKREALAAKRVDLIDKQAVALYEQQDRIDELERALKLALVYMDDDIQMLFDMDRHGIETDVRSVNQQAYEFNRLAKLVGFKSKYHPRIKEQDDERV